jgi:hypothetical protein
LIEHLPGQEKNNINKRHKVSWKLGHKRAMVHQQDIYERIPYQKTQMERNNLGNDRFPNGESIHTTERFGEKN